VHLSCSLSFSACSAGAGGSDPGSGRVLRKRSAQRENEIEEEAPARNRQKSVYTMPPAPSVRSKGKRKNYKKMSLEAYTEYRKIDPYLTPRSSSFSDASLGAWFHNQSQLNVYLDCYVKQKNVVPEQRWIDFKHMMKKDPDYFGEAIDMCENFVLLPIMDIQQNYITMFIAQFYATVHFGSPLLI